MKKLFEKTALIVSAIGIILFAVSCKKDTEPMAKDASVSLRLTATSTSEIQFEITPENAVCVYYALAETPQIQDAQYSKIDVTDDQPLTVSKTDLKEGTEYTIKAYAENADGKKSEEKTITATTTENASISIEVTGKTSHSVKFKLNPVNAVQYAYAAIEASGSVDNAEFTTVEGGEPGEYEIDGLSPNTTYSIVAKATNAGGNECAPVFQSVKTETEPVIKVTDITAEAFQAKVTVEIENVSEIAYATVVKGEAQPEKDKFQKTKLTGGNNFFMITELEPETEYTLYTYGINTTGYAGEISSQDFTTAEYQTAPFEIKVSNITSTDADVEVLLDKEVYSKYYFVLGPASYITDTESWDWEEIIAGGFSLPQFMEYTDNMQCRLRTWGSYDLELEIEGLYRIGGVPVKPDGTLDLEAAIWTSAQLKPVTFAESALKCDIEEISISLDAFNYKVNVDNTADMDCFYVNSVNGEITGSKVEEYAKSAVLTTRPVYNAGKDTTKTYLRPGQTYTFIAVAKDKSGKLSSVASKVITTKPADFEGNSECTATLSSISMSDAVFNCKLGANAVKILYYSAKKDGYYNEDQFLTSLKVNNYQQITADGDIKFEGLEPDTEYVFGFAPVDKDGVPGKCVITTATTKGFEFDGNPEAKVEINILSCETNPYGGYKVKVTATPNENVSYYYIRTVSDYETGYTYSQFANQCLLGWYDKYTSATTLSGWDGTGEAVGDNASVWVLAVDKDGKYVQVAVTPIEETKK